MKKKLVEVVWQDPTTFAGWVDDEDMNKPLHHMRTYGILIRRKPEVVVAGTVNSDEKKSGRYADVSKFPLGCIVSINEIATIEVK
jgi:hypothetical protein